MKLLIIIVALVAASFVLMLAYGVGRDEPPPGEQGNYAPPISEGEIDDDRIDDWEPPSITQKTTALHARFVKGLTVERPLVTINSMQNETRMVPPTDKYMRAAKLRLVAGGGAIVRGPNDGRACLCRENAPIDEALFSECGKRWLGKLDNGHCRPKFDTGILGFDENGGAMVFVKGTAAKVRIVEE